MEADLALVAVLVLPAVDSDLMVVDVCWILYSSAASPFS